MYRRDYIERMLEEFARMLGHVMGLRSENLEQQALQELRDGYKTYFGLDAGFLRELKPEDILDVLSKTELKPPQVEALARALMTEGELLETVFPHGAFDCRLKALILFRHLEETDAQTFSLPRKNAIRHLEGILHER